MKKMKLGFSAASQCSAENREKAGQSHRISFTNFRAGESIEEIRYRWFAEFLEDLKSISK